MYTVEQLTDIIAEAKAEARQAADHYFQTKLGGVDQYGCGFAWTSIYELDGQRIKGNTKIGRALKKAGIDQNWRKTFELWNPSEYPCQNVDTLEAGARAAAKVFEKYGFKAYAGSRLD